MRQPVMKIAPLPIRSIAEVVIAIVMLHTRIRHGESRTLRESFHGTRHGVPDKAFRVRAGPRNFAQ